MSNERLTELRRIPLPRGNEPVSWLMDMTPQRWIRKTWLGKQAPYTFSPCGVRVRMMMPSSGRRKTRDVLAKLTEQATVRWIREEMAREAGVPVDSPPEQIAAAVYVKAVMAPDSPFLCILVYPNGRVVAFSGSYPPPHHQVRSWHPSVPWGGVA